MIYIMVSRVTRGDVFKSELSDEADHARVARLQCTVSAAVHRPKFADKSCDDDLRWIEHRLTIQILGEFSCLSVSASAAECPQIKSQAIFCVSGPMKPLLKQNLDPALRSRPTIEVIRVPTSSDLDVLR